MEKKPLIDHFLELRKRLILSLGVFFVAFCVCYFYSDAIFKFLSAPLTDILKEYPGRKLIYTSLTEAFLTYIKVGIFAATFVCFPFFATQAWLFIAPGLYKSEKNIFLFLLFITTFLFFAGAAFSYFVVFPKAYAFFLSFESPATPDMVAIQLEAKVNEYLSFAMRIILAFGISFEMPVFLAVLAKIGVISSKTLKKYWRLAIVIIFALSALITPPDIISMVALAVPLIILYWGSLLLMQLWEKKQTLPKE